MLRFNLPVLPPSKPIDPICPMVQGECIKKRCVHWLELKCLDKQGKVILDDNNKELMEGGCKISWAVHILLEHK